MAKTAKTAEGLPDGQVGSTVRGRKSRTAEQDRQFCGTLEHCPAALIAYEITASAEGADTADAKTQ